MKVLLSLLFALFALTSFAQTTQTSHTSSSYHSETNVDGVDIENDGYSASISIRESDHVFRYNARFEPVFNEDIYEFLQEILGSPDRASNKMKEWRSNDGIYEVSLRKNKLYISLDKDELSGAKFRELKKMANHCSKIMDGKNKSAPTPPTPPTPPNF